MPYENGIIFIDTTTTPPRGVSIRDVGRALGRGTRDLGALCSDQEWYIDHYTNEGTAGFDPGDRSTWGDPVRALRQVNKINPLALWKPFRSSQRGFDTAAEQRAAIIAAGCGFGTFPTFHINDNYPATTIPHNVWEYLKPRGEGGGANNTDEWYRINDFAPLDGGIGYYVHAVSPIYVMWPSDLSDPTSVSPKMSIVIRTDGSGDAEHWRQNLCISFADLFPSGSSYANYRVAVLFKNSRGSVVAVSPASVADMNASTANNATVTFSYSDIQTLVPSIGNTVEAAVCLIQNSGYSTTDTTILTNYTGTLVSLEMKSGCDRKTLKYVGSGSIVGMSGTATITLGAKAAYSQAGFSCYYPIEQVDITLTAGPDWRNLTSVNLQLSFTCTGAMGNSSYPGAPANFTFPLALSAGQTRTFTAAFKRGVDGFDLCAYVPSTADATMTVAFQALQGSSVQNLTASGSPFRLAR